MSDEYKPSAARQKLLSDDNIKYFYTKSGELHIKTCEMARNIPDSELQYSNTFVEGIPICKHCEREI